MTPSGKRYHLDPDCGGKNSSATDLDRAINMGKTPLAYAFPFGSFSPESTEILKECGFRITLTCEEKINKIKKAEPDSLFGLGRYNRPEGISSEIFFEKMGIC